MRFAAYAGTSMVLATGVIVRALHQRANWYSACVYLAQSNACLMILTNLSLLGVATVMLGLQKLFYGALRPIEVEQLYEKAWFAITETCLAMTIFREEVGGWFLVMFVCLLIGKVWGWIGEGRVDILEQQPPANPRLFHARLSFSLIISIMFDMYMLCYSVHTVLRQARPNMMVMFAFEFAVLTVTSLSTAARYTISLHEAAVIKEQTNARLDERRAQIRQGQEQARVRESGQDHDEARPDGTATEDNFDATDIDVPGWEEKGRWVFYLDLLTDFLKLILYLTFFCVLCMFYGMPIHIIRDVALTIRSFYKRINDFLRYRHATRDMNARYSDATPEEIASEDVCIICRENMRPWRQLIEQDTLLENGAMADRGTILATDERLRPKKLPCGHILHFACLRSWLERQQNCPTCRRPVLGNGATQRTIGPQPANQNPRVQARQDQLLEPVPARGGGPQRAVVQNRIRTFNIGPFHFRFGTGQGIQAFAQHVNNNQLPPQEALPPGAGDFQHLGIGFGYGRQNPAPTAATFSPTDVQIQLSQIEQQLIRDISGLRAQAEQLHLVRALQSELARLRLAQVNPAVVASGGFSSLHNHRPLDRLGQTTPNPPTVQAFGLGYQQPIMGAGHPGLPPGITIPDGWTILPLQRLPNVSNSSLDLTNDGQSVDINAQASLGHSVVRSGSQDSANPNPAQQSSGPLNPQPSVLLNPQVLPRSVPPTDHINTTDTSQSIGYCDQASNSQNGRGNNYRPQTTTQVQHPEASSQNHLRFLEPVEQKVVSQVPLSPLSPSGELDSLVQNDDVSAQSEQYRLHRLHDEPSETSNTREREAGKGKARAATVEDDAEDMD